MANMPFDIVEAAIRLKNLRFFLDFIYVLIIIVIVIII